MSRVAKAADVATGTAYVHYESKEDLVIATYLEIKHDLGAAVALRVDAEAAPKDRYRQLWTATYDHLTDEPARARFLTQMEESPFYAEAHRQLLERGDRLVEMATSEDLIELLVPLPLDVIYVLTLGVAVRLVAGGIRLGTEEVEMLVAATWRAVAAE